MDPFHFKVPETVPQDLLLIQDLVGPIPSPCIDFQRSLGQSRDFSDDSVGSSDNDADSEEEVEADLLLRDNENVAQPSTALPDIASQSEAASDSDSDSEPNSSSLSEEEDQLKEVTSSHTPRPTFDVDDEDSGTPANAACLQTKNEVVDVDIKVPTISEVDSDEDLEKVGEIMSIVGNIAIVRGLPADQVKILSERALDTESLLVFEDRKVLGYIYETFGPTSQPLYQIKFNQHYPLDTERVRVAREIFHVPKRSHFVFVDQLKKLRGSDASNIHDEEPAEDEIEFSDDEQEAAFKLRHRKRRGQSVSSSRQSTPASSRSHLDDVVDDTFYGTNPYSAHGPYDDDFTVTRPPRPAPMPYDDPYTEPADIKTVTHSPTERSGSDSGHDDRFPTPMGWENSHDKAHNSSRPRTPRDRPPPGRGSPGKTYRNRQAFRSARRSYKSHSATSEGTNLGRSLAPTPYGVEFATPRLPANAAVYSSAQPSWSCPSSNLPSQNYYQPFVQPHINPRFASAFGINLQGASRQWQEPQNSPHPTLPPQQGWDHQWTVHDTAGSDRSGYGPM
ncbi:Gar1/Naf1 RNA binding region-domain-containing protein [Phlebopus sp. FC_14]|nr:Gar1/Naf1 RNA binding region-domain-containing protein [Phlebopus sp. FC_14]